MSTVPNRSLPPPQVPTELVAAARIRTLEEESTMAQDDLSCALLTYELGAQLERAGAERELVLEKYRGAYRTHRALRTPLLALARLHSDPLDKERLPRVLSALHHGTPHPRIRAAFLVEQARVLLDHLGLDERATPLLQAAVQADPSYQEAAHMLEHYHASQGQLTSAMKAVARRAVQVADPALRGALLLEVADHALHTGEVAEAKTALLEASQLGHGRYTALERLYQLALRADEPAQAHAALSQLASLASDFAREGDDAVEDDNAPLGRFSAPAVAAEEAAVHFRELSRLSAAVEAKKPEDELQALQSALNHRQDQLLWQEYLFCCVRTSAHAQAAFAAERLYEALPLGISRACWIYYQARAEAARGNQALALDLFRQAATQYPSSPALISAFERQLWESGELAELCTYLQQRAEQDEDDRDRLRQKAAHLALRHLDQAGQGEALIAGLDPQRPATWLDGQRLLYAEADRTTAEDGTALRDAARQTLLSHSQCREEQTYLRRIQYAELRDAGPEHVALQLSPALRRYLVENLTDDRSADWLPHAARALAAHHHDFELLARAHTQLSEAGLTPAERTAHLCAAARAHIRHGDLGASEVPLRAALSLEPDNPYAVSLMQPVLLRQGQVTEAIELLRDNARCQANPQQAVSILLAAGMTAEQAQDTSVAAERYKEALSLDGTSTAAAYAMLSLGHRVQSQALLRDALRHLDQQGVWPVAALELSESWDAAGDFEQGDHFARRALGQPELRLAAALRLWTYGTSTGARDAGLTVLRTRHPCCPWGMAPPAGEAALGDDSGRGAHFRRALAALAPILNLERQAPQTLADAYHELSQLSQAPKHHAAFMLHALRMGQLAGGEGGRNDAVLRALSLRMAAPDLTETALALDELVQTSDDPKVRLLALSGRVRPYESSAPLAVRLAVAEEQLTADQPDAALHSARGLLRENEDDLASLELLREAAFQTDMYSELAYADELLAQLVGPTTGSALLLEAAICHGEKLGAIDDAERCLRRCLALAPDHDEAFCRLHDLLAERADLAGLLPVLRARLDHISDDDERVDILFESALVHYAQNDLAASHRDLEQALLLCPHHPDALRLTAQVQSERGLYREAVAALSALAQTGVPEEERRSARLTAADLLTTPALQDPLAAIEQLQRLHQAGIANTKVYQRLGDLSLAMGLNGDAVHAFTTAAKREQGAQQSQLLLRAAHVRERVIGDASAALQDYRDALRACPTHRSAHEGIQRLTADPRRRLEEASRFLNQVHVRLTAQPLDAELLRGMRSGAKASGLAFAEYAALDVLFTLNLADDEEREARLALIGDGAHRRTEPIDDEAVRLLRKKRDGGIGKEIAKVCSLALTQLHDFSLDAHGVSRRQRIKRGPLHDLLDAQLNRCGLQLRHLYQGGEQAHGLKLLSTGKPPMIDCVVGRDTKPTGLSERQAYELGCAAMAHHQETSALFELPADKRRDALVATARAAELPLTPLVPTRTAEELSRRIHRFLTRRQRKRLQAAAAPLGPLWPAIDWYLEATEVTWMRSGLLLCGQLEVALHAALTGQETDEDGSRQPAERPRTVELALSETGSDLLRFWTSTPALTLHGERRRELQREQTR